MDRPRKSGMIRVILPLQDLVESRMTWNERAHVLQQAENWCAAQWQYIKNDEGDWNSRGLIFWFRDPEKAWFFEVFWSRYREEVLRWLDQHYFGDHPEFWTRQQRTLFKLTWG